MIFSLNTALRMPADTLMYEGSQVAYSYGNVNALNKWIDAMNKKQLTNVLGIPTDDKFTKKYPLIWLTDEWVANKITPGYQYTNVNFYIACNTTVNQLSEQREPNFELLYKVANEWIKKLKPFVKIADESIRYYERANLYTSDQSHTIDYWDAIVLSMDIVAYTNCLKKMCSL